MSPPEGIGSMVRMPSLTCPGSLACCMSDISVATGDTSGGGWGVRGIHALNFIFVLKFWRSYSMISLPSLATYTKGAELV